MKVRRVLSGSQAHLLRRNDLVHRSHAILIEKYNFFLNQMKPPKQCLESGAEDINVKNEYLSHNPQAHEQFFIGINKLTQYLNKI